MGLDELEALLLQKEKSTGSSGSPGVSDLFNGSSHSMNHHFSQSPAAEELQAFSSLASNNLAVPILQARPMTEMEPLANPYMTPPGLTIMWPNWPSRLPPPDLLRHL